MKTNGFQIAFILLLVCLCVQAHSQGYMGTVTTGTGILTPLSIGKAVPSSADIGTRSSQENLTGNWSVDMRGTEENHLDLKMFQKGDIIMGSGKWNSLSDVREIIAAGSVMGDEITVFICLPDYSEVLRMQLSSSGASLAGKFETLSAYGLHEFGTATGNMVLLAAHNQAKSLSQGINPGATAGAWVGNSAKIQEGEGSTGRVTKKLSIYKSSTGQGDSTTSVEA